MAVESIVINIAFFSVCGLLFLPAKNFISSFISSCAYLVSSQVEDAMSAKSNAKCMLSEISVKESGLENKINQILVKARQKASSIELKAKAESLQMIEHKRFILKKELQKHDIVFSQNLHKKCTEAAFLTVSEIAQGLTDDDSNKLLTSVCGKLQKIS